MGQENRRADGMLVRALATVAFIPGQSDDPREIDHSVYITNIYVGS